MRHLIRQRRFSHRFRRSRETALLVIVTTLLALTATLISLRLG